MNNDITEQEKDQYNKIFEGINGIKKYLESHPVVDEYVYVLLWRPVEWITDFYGYQAAVKDGCDVGEYWKAQAGRDVNAKVKACKELVSEEVYKALRKLRDYRDRCVHRYRLKAEPNVFGMFDLVCHDFYQKTGKKSQINKKAAAYQTKIEISQGLDESDAPAGERDQELVGQLLDALEQGDEDQVVLACKMELLAQRYAKELLEAHGHTFRYNNTARKGGIYIDDDENSILTYIDYYVKYHATKAERHTQEALDAIRLNRNAIIHELKCDEKNFHDMCVVWNRLMQEYFCDHKEVCKRLKTLDQSEVSLDDLIEHVNAYAEQVNEFTQAGIMKEINRVLVILQCIMKKYEDLKDEFDSKIRQANSEEEREKLQNEYCIRVSEIYQTYLKQIAESEMEKYEREVDDSLGELKDEIEKETRGFLTCACLLADTFEQKALGNPDLDCGGACIEFTRAVELFLYKKIFREYKTYREKQDLGMIPFFRENDYQNDLVTLGSYQYIFGLKKKNNGDMVQTPAFSEYVEFCREQQIYKVSDKNKLERMLREEYQQIDQVKTAYRDKTAHREKMEIETLRACKADVLASSNALIKKLISDLNQ